MKLKKILVPVDFSDFSDNAVEFALLMAEKFDAEVMLLHTVLLFEQDLNEKEHLEAYETLIQQKENERTKKMKAHYKRGEKRGVTVDSVLLRGVAAADSILDYLSDNDYDLVVMGTHGHTGIVKFFAGSTTEKVVRFSPIPVITVHKDYKRQKIEEVLVPIDFSEYSHIAIEQGKAIAKEFNAKIFFMHVVEQDAHPEFYSITSEPILEANPQLKGHIINSLKKYSGMSEDEAHFVVGEGKVHNEIIKHSEKNEVDLIVMPTVGQSDLEHIIIGSTTERVVRVATCPVMTVRKSTRHA